MKIEESWNGKPGVFLIRNTENQKVLIGIAEDIGQMIRDNETLLKAGKHTNYPFQVDYRVSPPDTFEAELLEDAESCDFESLLSVCSRCVKEFDAKNFKHGYNTMVDAFQYTQQNLAKMYAEIKENEEREARSKRMKGKRNALGSTRSVEQRERQSELMTGRTQTQEHIDKRVEAKAENRAKRLEAALNEYPENEIEESPFK